MSGGGGGGVSISILYIYRNISRPLQHSQHTNVFLFFLHFPLLFSLPSPLHCQWERVWFYQTKTSRMLVFCLYLVREKKPLKICL